MSDVKALLDEATPLPWKAVERTVGRYVPSDDPVRDVFVLAGDHDFQIGSRPDARFIVYAVNHLPDYEAAVDALERLLGEIVIEHGHDENSDAGWPVCKYRHNTMAAARAALARLRDEPDDEPMRGRGAP